MAGLLNIIGKLFGNKYDKDVKEIAPLVEQINNEFASLSTQIGLVGLFLYAIFLFNLYLDSRNNILAQGAFIIIFISCIFNSAIYDNILGLFIVLIIGITHQKNTGYPMLGKHNNKIFS